MKKTYSPILTIAAVLISILFMASIAAAQLGPQRGGIGRGLGKWWKNPRMVKALELTEEQQKALNELSLEKEKEIIKLNSEKRLKQLDLRTEMEKTRPDLKKVKEIVSSMNETQGKIRLLVITGMVEGKNLLSEAQVEKLNDVINRTRDQRQKMIGKRMGGPNRQWQGPRDDN